MYNTTLDNDQYRAFTSLFGTLGWIQRSKESWDYKHQFYHELSQLRNHSVELPETVNLPGPGQVYRRRPVNRL